MPNAHSLPGVPTSNSFRGGSQRDYHLVSWRLPDWPRKLTPLGHHAVVDSAGGSRREHAQVALHGGADRRDLEGG